MATSLILIAFAAGVLSFVSPCIIPMLGVYFSLITGLSSTQLKEAHLDPGLRRRVIKNTLAFVGGFGLVFIAAGALAGELGALMSKWQGVLNFLGGTVILILALKLLGLFELPFLTQMEWQPAFFDKLREKSERTAGASFIVGILFSIACSHCIAPTLYSVLALAGGTKGPLIGMTVMLFFSVGLAIPYVVAGLYFNRMLGLLKHVRSRQRWVERVAGLLMLYLSYVMYTNQLSNLTGYLAQFLPRLPIGM